MYQPQPNFKQKKKKLSLKKKKIKKKKNTVPIHLESINLVFSNTLKKGNKIKKHWRKEKKNLRKPW